MADNYARNKTIFDARYAEANIDQMVERVENAETFIAAEMQVAVQWAGVYFDQFHRQIEGATVLELGAGRGLDTLLLAKLGAAHVTAVDITDTTTMILDEATRRLDLQDKVSTRIGDFVTMDFEPQSFDFILGRAFLHHLTHDIEDQYLKKIAALLKADGQARFFEPAVNSKFLDSLRWMVPVRGRPSALNRRAFAEWKQRDPHPPRDDSTGHYRDVCGHYFDQVEIRPIGGIQRLHRFLKYGEPIEQTFSRTAFQIERTIPANLHLSFARSQTIIARQPKR
jgi:ubiquinone/menaquinone biosynthesis C-methylase UbiE